MGPSQASMEGEAVESRFQSSFVKSIFFEMGVLGGAAKLNQVVFSSAEPEAVDLRPPPADTAWLATAADDPDGLAAAAAATLSSVAAAECALPAVLTLSSLPKTPSSGVDWWRGTVVSTCEMIKC